MPYFPSNYFHTHGSRFHYAQGDGSDWYVGASASPSCLNQQFFGCRRALELRSDMRLMLFLGGVFFVSWSSHKRGLVPHQHTFLVHL